MNDGSKEGRKEGSAGRKEGRDGRKDLCGSSTLHEGRKEGRKEGGGKVKGGWECWLTSGDLSPRHEARGSEAGLAKAVDPQIDHWPFLAPVAGGPTEATIGWREGSEPLCSAAGGPYN